MHGRELTIGEAAIALGVSTDTLARSMFNMLKSVNQNEAALQSYGATVVRAFSSSDIALNLSDRA